MPVPFLDLNPQYESLKEELDEAVRRVVSSQRFILGPEVESLEEEVADYLGVAYAVGVASGTDALLLPLKALEPGPGEEVIVPAFTFFATAGAVWNAGYTPTFCDVDPSSFNVTAETLEASWTEQTRAVIPVHLYGQMAPMPEIRAWANDRGVFVLEDAAQAIGARQSFRAARFAPAETDPHLSVEESATTSGWAMAGCLGNAGAFSFFPTKNLGGFGDGGMVTTHDEVLAEKVAKLRVHGGRQMYHHEKVGTNSRLDALQAAVLRTKLPHLDAWAERRRRNAGLYDEFFSDLEEVETPLVAEGNHHVYNQYTLRVRARDELREFLSQRGVGNGIYYPKALHLQECFQAIGGREGDLPVAEQLTREVISLPIFPELTEAQVAEVAASVREFFRA
ncbi:DegT/DnrJ/EryC1/StrS family aminotransferase [Gemmatimonadota bacterium]